MINDNIIKKFNANSTFEETATPRPVALANDVVEKFKNPDIKFAEQNVVQEQPVSPEENVEALNMEEQVVAPIEEAQVVPAPETNLNEVSSVMGNNEFASVSDMSDLSSTNSIEQNPVIEPVKEEVTTDLPTTVESVEITQPQDLEESVIEPVEAVTPPVIEKVAGPASPTLEDIMDGPFVKKQNPEPSIEATIQEPIVNSEPEQSAIQDVEAIEQPEEAQGIVENADEDLLKTPQVVSKEDVLASFDNFKKDFIDFAIERDGRILDLLDELSEREKTIENLTQEINEEKTRRETAEQKVVDGIQKSKEAFEELQQQAKQTSYQDMPVNPIEEEKTQEIDNIQEQPDSGFAPSGARTLVKPGGTIETPQKEVFDINTFEKGEENAKQVLGDFGVVEDLIQNEPVKTFNEQQQLAA